MKAAVFYEVRQLLRIEELEMPAVNDEDVLIKTFACGVCHTDLKVVEGRNRFNPPTVLGHEVSGTIERVGSRCTEFFKEGDAVIVGMRYKCGRCRYCLGARENLCVNRPAPPPLRKTDGTPVTRWNVGGFAEYVSVPGYMIFKVPQEISLEEASVIGCRVTTAYNAVKHVGELAPGDSALVIGCGGVGLNAIQFLKCFGAYPIIAVDVIDKKLEEAKKFGATHTINAKTSDQIIQATRPGGTATIIGGLGSGPFTISSGSFVTNEIAIKGVSSRRANDVVEVLQMVQDGRIDVKSLITKKYGHEQINEALEDLEHGKLLMGISMWN